jgi:hypothetical protein
MVGNNRKSASVTLLPHKNFDLLRMKLFVTVESNRKGDAVVRLRSTPRDVIQLHTLRCHLNDQEHRSTV